MSALSRSITDRPLIDRFKSEIAYGLFGQGITSTNFATLGLGPYFDYYEQQCAFARIEDDGEDDGGDSSQVQLTPIVTHSFLLQIIGYLKDTSLTRESITSLLLTQFGDVASRSVVSILIDLAARLYLMIPIGGRGLGQHPCHWREGHLQHFLESLFTPEYAETEAVKLEPNFHAQNIQNSTGMRIFWTSNLSDHLSMSNYDRDVHIFHHASFLILQSTS